MKEKTKLYKGAVRDFLLVEELVGSYETEVYRNTKRRVYLKVKITLECSDREHTVFMYVQKVNLKVGFCKETGEDITEKVWQTLKDDYVDLTEDSEY